MADIATIGFKADTSGITKAERELNKLQKAGGGVDNQLMTMRNTLRIVGTALAALGISSLTSDLIANADAWKLISNQIRQVTSTEEELVGVRSQLLKISKETNSELDVTVDLYSNLYRSTRSLGLAQSEVAGITKTINNLFLAGGKTAAETAGAVRQLAQGLAAGALRGDEFNSVAEGAPRIMDALAAKLNMTRGELRDFAATGGITAEILTSALSDYSEEAQRMADLTERTFGMSMVNARTNVVEFVGSLDSVDTAVTAAGKAIEGLTENLDTITDVAGGLAVLLGARLTASAASSAAALTLNAAAALKSTTSINAYGVAVRSASASQTIMTGTTSVLSGAMTLLGGPVGVVLVAAAAMYYFATRSSEAEKIVDSLVPKLDGVADSMERMGDAEAKLRQLSIIDELKEVNDLLEEQKKHLDDVRAGRRNVSSSLTGDFSFVDDVESRAVLEAEAAVNRTAKAVSLLKQEFNSLSDNVDISMVVHDLTNGAIASENFSGVLKKGFNDIPVMLRGVSTGVKNVATELTAAQKKAVDSFNSAVDALNLERIALEEGELAAYAYQLQMSELAETEIKALVAAKEYNIALRDRKEAVNEFMSGDISNAFGSDLIDQGKEVELTWGGAFDAIADGLGKVQSTMADGSKEAENLGRAMQALQVVQGISAILNQGMGDPYSAIGRMAAMAAAVASLIGSVGFAGEGSTAAADAQAVQGTGTVLGNSTAQSESILNATETTADATAKLVGINTGMLDALRTMQAGINSATGMIVRGMPDQIGSTRTSLFDMVENPILKGDDTIQEAIDPVWSWLNENLGGSSDVINSGISLLGGTISDLISGTAVAAFQDVEEKKHIFDDKDVTRFSEFLGGEVGAQFSLIFGGMSDAILAASDVLGESESEIQDRVSRFRIAAQDISLKDLTGEEQEAALGAVFSSIFDNLAGSVIPYIDQFAMVGEGISETLIRVATQVQVADAYMDNLGNTLLDGLAGQELAQMSDDLIQAAGGLEAFMETMGNFVNTFATDEHKLRVATESINSAFSQMGLEVPSTRDAVWTLMQGLTDPAQIARVANLTDALDDYYAAQEEIDNERQGLTLALLQELGDEENALTMQRVMALEAIDESNQALQQQIWMLGDYKAALNDAMSATDSALEGVRGAVGREQDSVNSLYDAQIEAANNALGKTSDGISRFIARTQESVGELNSLAATLASSAASNAVTSDAATRAQRANAMALISSALGSNIAMGDIAGLEGAAGILSGGVGGLFANESQANIAAGEAAFALNALSEKAETQASAAERTVAALERRSEIAQEEHNELIAELEASRDLELTALDQVILDAESMVNSLRGIEASEISIDDALQVLNESVSNEETARQQLETMKEQLQQTQAMGKTIEDMKAQLADLATRQLRELEQQTDSLIQQETA